MVSIKRYLSNTSGEIALRQAVGLLIQKLGDCAIDTYPLEGQDFREEIGAIREALIPSLPNESFLVLAESAAQALETYTSRIERLIGRQNDDLQTIIRMFQESLLTIAGGGTQSAGLTKISEELERGAGFKDLQSLKLHLGECLSSLRDEIEREKTASKMLIEKLQIQIESFQKSPERLPQNEVDPATGALLKGDGIAAIQRAIDRGTRHYIVVMTVNRIQPINARFGRDAGDWMLLRFKEHVQSLLHASDQLFRWTGPAIVAILERPEGFDYVRAAARRMLETRIEITYQANGRSVLIPVSAAWSVFMLTSTPEEINTQIETFIAGQGYRDYA
jgi:GGDEF domain-containing protein